MKMSFDAPRRRGLPAVPLAIGFAAALVIFIALPVRAMPKGFLVNADRVSYDQNTGTVEASGSVEAFTKNIRMTADRVYAWTKEAEYHLRGNVSLYLEDYTVHGDQVVYNVKSRRGEGTNVAIRVGHVGVKSKTVSLYPNRVELANANVTSCELENPHYLMTADRMTYYSRNGWVVFQNGFLYIQKIPVLWIPTYVYDLGSVEDRRHTHPAPFPDIESNLVDGTSLEDKILFRLTDYSYGMVRVKYAEKQGFGLGAESNYFINDTNEGRLRIMTWGREGTFGGITHIFSFGDILKGAAERKLVYEVLQTPPRRNYELFTEMSFRERVNFERVSLLPNLMLRASQVPLGLPFLTWSGEVSVANIQEESTRLQRTRARGILEGQATVLSDALTDVKSGIHFNLAEYDLKTQWSQIIGDIHVNRVLTSWLKGGLTYSHYFYLDGLSPFKFENYQYFASNFVGMRLESTWSGSRLGASVEYNLPSGTRKTMDFKAGMGFDCFEILATWQTVQGNFLVGVNLLN